MWDYASHEWWGDMIFHHVLKSTSLSDRFAIGRDGLTLNKVETTYASTLSTLRGDSLDPLDAEYLLFASKALRKWRLADSSRADRRRNEAFDGFIQRNDRAGAAEPLSWAFKVHMRDFLMRALPEVPSTGTEGRFGPKAVMEGFNMIDKYRVLSRSPNPSFTGESDTISEPAGVCRMCSVPKTYSKDRLITVEQCMSTLRQFYCREMLLRSIHSGSLRGTVMDMLFRPTDHIQGRLAKKASLTKRHATLDLKDGSDNVTFVHVSQVFPRWILIELERARAEYFVDPRDKRRYPLHIYGGMGNATTFIVETLFFAAYVYAFARIYNLSCYVSVYGDDVICDSLTANALLMRGDEGPFRLNREKSFTGVDSLRESCGVFAYKGVDITVPKIDGYRPSWEGRQGLCDLLNGALHPTVRPELFEFWDAIVASLPPNARSKRPVLGYPIADIGYWAEYECAEMTPSRDPLLQRSMVKLRVKEARVRHLRQSTFSGDEIVALTWGSLVGQVHSSQRQLRGKLHLTIPLVDGHGAPCYRRRWVEVLPQR